MRMHQAVLSIVTLALSASVAFAQGGTEFTYQGRLLDAGAPANGTFNVDFRLWDDPAAGNQVDATNTFNSLPILEGLFTVELDFGADAFDNNDRWLEITVDGVPLVPRQPITRTPYAIQTRGIFVDDSGRVGIGTEELSTKTLQVDGGSNPIAVSGENIVVGGIGVFGLDANTSGLNYGVFGRTDSLGGIGVRGFASSASGANYGVFGRTDSSEGTGVYGFTPISATNSRAVSGKTNSPDGYAGYFEGGRNYFQGNVGIGTEDPQYSLHVDGSLLRSVFAETDAYGGYGVYGLAKNFSGFNAGVFGNSRSDAGVGVYGYAEAIIGEGRGVVGETFSYDGIGVHGLASIPVGTNFGVFGESNSTSGRGVYGYATASSGTTYGVYGRSDSASGFAGYFRGSGNDAVYVTNTSDGRGLQAVAPSDTAVWGRTTTGFAGVHGANAAATGRGVYGQASDTSGTNYGVYGASSSASGYDFYAGGAGVNYGASSSRRWKNNVVPISEPLVKLAQLRGVYFDWDEEHGGAHDVGMIAEEVGAVLPEVVQFEENSIDASGMDYSKMTPLLVEAVNALRAEKDDEISSLRAEKDSEITSLHAENRELRAAHAELQQRFDTLESLVSRLTTENN